MSEVLVGKTRVGDFVHSSQGTAGEQGFKCVSRLWYPKTKPLSEGIDQLVNDARSREDLLCPAKHMGMGINDDGKFVLEYIDGREFVPTPHAFRQLATWCKVSHQFIKDMTNPVRKQNGEIEYERDARDNETLLQVMRNGYRRLEAEKAFRFRTYTDGTLRAVLSDRYAIINNVWYLETLAELFREIGGDEPRLSHWRGDADTLYGNILIPDTCRADKDSDYGGMISVSQCEIGIRRLSQFPSIFRAICMNGCIWDQEQGTSIHKVHRGEIDLNDLRQAICDNIHSQIPLMAEGVAKFLALKDKVVAKDVKLANIIAVIANEHKLSYGQKGQAANVATKFLDFEMENENLFGLVNAITRAGQDYEPAEWVRLDSVAGSLMNMSDSGWDKLQARARAIDPKLYAKVYGISV
jgi:hypothetical protein